VSLVFDPFVVVVGRAEVELARTVDTLATLRHWIAIATHQHHVRGRLRLVFDGYDTDPRELWFIPGV
jgi:hypothetical protein